MTPFTELIRVFPDHASIYPVMISPVAVTPLILVVMIFPEDTRDAVLMIDPVPIDPPIFDVIRLPVLVRELGTEREVTESAPEMVTSPFW